MDVWSWLWIAWFAMFAGVEGTALILGRGTLTSKVMWLITGAGPWHQIARVALIVLLGWLPLHFRLPFTDWQSVWPNIVASIVWSVPAVFGFIHHHRKLKAHHAQALADHHESLMQRIRDELGIGHDAGA